MYLTREQCQYVPNGHLLDGAEHKGRHSVQLMSSNIQVPKCNAILYQDRLLCYSCMRSMCLISLYFSYLYTLFDVPANKKCIELIIKLQYVAHSTGYGESEKVMYTFM